MIVHALWYGGSSYAAPSPPEDFERFDSLRTAVEEFRRRFEGHDSYYPCVEGSEMLVFFGRDEPGGDLYPDRILREGPRGGVVVERC